MDKLIWWVFTGTAGGPNRARIVRALNERPYNAHQLAEKLNLNYTTVRHHLKILEQNKMIESTSKYKYGMLYFLTSKMEENYSVLNQILEKLS